MSKLFNLKEWLSVSDAARRLAIVFGEDVTEADVLRLALDWRLRLSVHFVNHAYGRAGKLVPIAEATYQDVPSLTGNGTVRLYKGPELNRGGQQYGVIELDDDIAVLTGVFDLTMWGAERLDVEHRYQLLTGGPGVSVSTLDGPFVKGLNGQIIQLLNDFDDNEFVDGSRAQLEELQQHIANDGISSDEAEVLLSMHKEKRKNFKETRKSRSGEGNYYPAPTLPDDSVLVVRTQALREFEASVSGSPTAVTTSREHVSDKLAKLNQAAAKFWANAGRDDRGTHPKNADIEVWLQEQGFSSTLAEKAASIIRPEWAPTGRRREE